MESTEFFSKTAHQFPTVYNTNYNKVQVKLWEIKDSWFYKVDEIDSSNFKRFCDALKAICWPQSTGTSSLLITDGNTLFIDKNTILERWAEHFNNVLNRPSSNNSEAIAWIPQIDINTSLKEPPTEAGVQKAIKHLSKGKAMDPDSIPAEIYKAVRPVLAQDLTNLFHTMWKQKVVHQELKDASLVHLYKRKSNI